MNLIAGRKENLVECQHKRMDAEGLESQARLLKQWKSGLQLKEEELHLHKQIQEAETKLESLELHAGDLYTDSTESVENRHDSENSTTIVLEHLGEQNLANQMPEDTWMLEDPQTLEEDYDWDRNGVNATPAPTPSEVVI